VIKRPTESSVDGIDLDRFWVGRVYDLPAPLDSLFLAEGWGESVADDEPVTVIPLSVALEMAGPALSQDTPPGETGKPIRIRDRRVAQAADAPSRRRTDRRR
jgi:hypothetical protein